MGPGNHREPPSSGLEGFFPPSAHWTTPEVRCSSPAQVDLADTVEQVQGQGNSEGGTSAVLLHDFKSRITSGLINGLARAWQFLTSEEIHTIQQVRARCGEAQRATARGALVHGQTGSVPPLHVNLLTPRTEGGARLHCWIGCGVDGTTPQIAKCGATLQAGFCNTRRARGWESYQGRRTIV